ncbi:MAG: TIGR03943 family protein [Clostridiales bacterium]|jgi:putative membrane protein|nr:TIGR03943 family protein [Clostridiales bacterium]
MYDRKKVLNPQTLLELLCYIAFAVSLCRLTVTGQYKSYVTPKMEPYFYFTVAVMGVWAVSGLFRLFQPRHKVRAAHCLILTIPVLLLLPPHTPINTAALSVGYVGGGAFAGFSGQSGYAAYNPPLPATIIEPGIADDTPSVGVEQTAAFPGLDAEHRKITVANEDFGLWIAELYDHMETYEGYTVVMTGAVFKDPELMNANEFVPARLMMSCCVADLTPAGLLCAYDGADGLSPDSWVTVEGTLFVGQYEFEGTTYADPQISVAKITPAEAVEGYIYPIG